MLDTQWNTGRLYSAEGQIIRATYDGAETILFHDFTRMISGEIIVSIFAGRIETEEKLRRVVLSYYDDNRYRETPASYQFSRTQPRRAP